MKEIEGRKTNVISLTCPTCGAAMELDEPRDTLYCMYCGQKLLLDHQAKRVKIEKTITINKNIAKYERDEAQIIKYEMRQKNIENIMSIIAIIIGLPIIAYMFYCFIHIAAK